MATQARNAHQATTASPAAMATSTVTAAPPTGLRHRRSRCGRESVPDLVPAAASSMSSGRNQGNPRAWYCAIAARSSAMALAVRGIAATRALLAHRPDWGFATGPGPVRTTAAPERLAAQRSSGDAVPFRMRLFLAAA